MPTSHLALDQALSQMEGNKRVRGLKIDMEGNLHTVEWDETRRTLSVLQEAVEGLVDLVRLRHGDDAVDMWVNDEGLYLFDVNYVATHVADILRGEHYQDYAGPVLFTGTDDEGNTTSLPPEAEAKIREIVSQMDPVVTEEDDVD